MQEQENIDDILYYLSVCFFIICFLMPQEVFYRFCMYVPFWSMMLASKNNNKNMYIFLFTLISYLRVFLMLGFNGRQNMNAKYLMPEILAGLDGHIRIISIIEMIKYYHKILILVKPILLGAAIIILFNCHYNKAKQMDLKIPYQISMMVYASCGILLLGVFGIGIFH